MATKAKHAFGALEQIDTALSSGKIDSYDILFVKDVNGKPYVGWIDKDGNKVIIDDSEKFAALESQLATKATLESIAELANQIALKADIEEVNAKIEEKVEEKVEEKIDEKIAEVGSAYEVIEF